MAEYANSLRSELVSLFLHANFDSKSYSQQPGQQTDLSLYLQDSYALYFVAEVLI